MPRTIPCCVLDMSWTCPGLVLGFQVKLGISTLSWVPKWSNVHTNTGTGMISNWFRSLGRYMDHFWHTWQTIWIWSTASPQTSPQICSYITQFLGPSVKLECTAFPRWWSVVQGGWYRLEYAIPLLYEFLMVYMLCLTDILSQTRPSIISNYTPHMLSNMSRFSGSRSGNLQSFLGGGVV